MHRNAAVAATLLLIAPTIATAYIDAGGARVTFCELTFEFRRIAVLTVEKIDVDRAAVVYRVAERHKGTFDRDVVKHVLRDDGRLPERLRGIKVGDRVVYFAGCVDRRSVVLTNAGWYLTSDPGGVEWESFAGFRPDLDAIFWGSPADLDDTLRRTLRGEPRIVKTRAQSSDAPIFVLVDFDWPHRKTAVLPPESTRSPRSFDEAVHGLASKSFAEKHLSVLTVGDRFADHPNSAAQLLKLRSADAPELRVAVAQMLGRVKFSGPDAIKALESMLDDSDRFACDAAAVSLARLRATSALPALAKSLKDRNFVQDFRTLRAAAAAHAILKIDPDSSVADSARRFLVDRLLNDDRADSYGTRLHGARLLGDIGPAARAAAPALVRRLKDGDEHVRVAAARALILCGHPDRAPAITILTAGLNSSDPLVRQEAERGLKAVRDDRRGIP